jgi:hypothetical protein
MVALAGLAVVGLRLSRQRNKMKRRTCAGSNSSPDEAQRNPGSFTKLSVKFVNAPSLIGGQVSKTHIAVKRGIRPVCDVTHQTMFERVVMD